MGVYALRDVYGTTSGDIVIGSNGDLQLAESDESLSGVANFIIRTDRGEYVPDNRVGADLGSFIGERMTSMTINEIESNLIQNLTKFAIARSDLQVHAVPLSHEEVGIIVGYGGLYIDKDGNVMDTTTHVLNYTFPYLEGGPISAS